MRLPWKKQELENLEAVHTHTHTHGKLIKLIKSIKMLGIILAIIVAGILFAFWENDSIEEYHLSEIYREGVTPNNETQFEEFVKADGTKYGDSPQDITMNANSKLDIVEELYGPYQFNYAGGNVVDKAAFQLSTIEEQYYSKLSTLEGYEWLSRFEDDNRYLNDDKLKNNDGIMRVRGNSTGGELVKVNEGDKIYKAYLVVAISGYTGLSGKYLLENYPVTLISPNGKYIETKIEHIRATSEANPRCGGYMDITEFVKDSGYGWYYCCNIPYSYNDAKGVDQYASWRIVVIEENREIPARALSLKLGTEISSGNPCEVSINAEGVKSKSEGNVTGQVFYSIEGGDLDSITEESNTLKLTIDEDVNDKIYKEVEGTNVSRTSVVPFVRIMTRNGKLVNTLSKIKDEFEANDSYNHHTYKIGETTYTLVNRLMGGDTDLIDINGEENGSTIEIGNNKTNFQFEFQAKNLVLQATVMGLAIDIEDTEYKTEINTEIESVVNENNVTVTGYSENVHNKEESGLFDTHSVINLDKDLIMGEDLSVKAYFQKGDGQEQITIPEENIQIKGHQVTIYWGEDKDENGEQVKNLSLYGYKMTFEITGLTVENVKEEYQNEISVAGYLYSNGKKTDIKRDEVAYDDSYIKYGTIKVTKNWVDDSNSENLRPDTITLKLFRDGIEDPIEVKEVDVEKGKNTQLIEFKNVLLEDSVGTYTYRIEEDDIVLENEDDYISQVEDISEEEDKLFVTEITNTLTGKTNKTITKQWEDKENGNNTRPENIKIKILRNGEVLEGQDIITLNVQNGETEHIFENLEKYDENGKLYIYTAEEEEIPEGYEKEINGLQIKNKLKTIPYKVEYYYDGELRGTETEHLTGKYKDLLETFNAKQVYGYRLATEEEEEETVNGIKGLPLELTNEREEENVIKVYYVQKDAQVKVKYLLEGTNREVSETKTLNGRVFDSFETEEAEDIPKNLKLSRIEGETEGEYTEDVKEVIYYYKYKDPIISNTNASKISGIDEIIEKNQEIPYTISYSTQIDEYIGKATITIVDRLPYEIDEENSEIAQGTYSKDEKTITWTETYDIDTYKEGQAKNINIEKQIKLVYKNVDVSKEELKNKVDITLKLDTPEKEETVTDENTLIQNFIAKFIVQKEWDDNENEKLKRPDSILIDIIAEPNNVIVTKELNQSNNWRYEELNVPKYNEATGEKIEYKVVEKEKNPNDLEYYEEPVIRKIENKSENETSYVFTITNSYKLKNTDLNTELVKTGPDEILTSKDIAEYTITFTADIADYIGEGKVKIVDYLPYKIDLDNSEIANGTYNDEAQTITWEEPIEHINTDLEGSKHIEIIKTIRVLYKDIDLTQEKMSNNVTGKIELFENETKDEEGTTSETEINVNGKVIVRFVDKETGEDIVNEIVDENGEIVEERYNYEETGKVGDEYVANEKEIENYDYVETEGEKTGRITEEDTEIIHYYVRSKAKVIVKYVERTTEIDEEGNKHEVLKELLPDLIIEGQVFDEYGAEEKRIENYRFVESTENTEGKMTKEDITVIYYYEKIESKVTVKYVERTIETDEEGNEHEVLKELLPEDVIEGYAGDEYETERKEVKNYRPAEPDPENAIGKMGEEETEVVYYYEKIPSGILSVEYVDIDTGEIIPYIENKTEDDIRNEETQEDETNIENEETQDTENNEEQEEITENGETEEIIEKPENYNYEIKGYVGDKYETLLKEIPYYTYVKSTDNTKGELTEEEDTVTYYYKKQIFDMSVNKYIENITVNGQNINFDNNKFMKQEVVGTMIYSTNIRLTYIIEVKNIGEIDGSIKIQDTLPEGFRIIELNELFKKTDDRNIEAEIELKSGETNTLKVTLEWITDSNNFGEKENQVKILETKNKVNFEDVNKENDNSKATIILAVKTGLRDNLRIYSLIITYTGVLSLIGYIIVKKSIILYE